MIISAAMALRIPVVCQQPEYVVDGALLSFDPNRVEMYRRLAYYVDAVLKGARPSDLPIEEPAKSWLMINLRTAKSLGIEIPGPILMRADQIIE
jgi:putative tryptophan/tyrosine transport system substrate-binding protein